MKRQPIRKFAHGSVFAAAVMAMLAAAPFPVQAEPATYKLDPDHLSVGFLVEHIGYAKVLGLFRAARGGFVFDEAKPDLRDVRIEIDTRSVFSNQAKRDEHLKGADFLNAAEFPRMVFTAAAARRTGDRTFAIDGQLELLGQSKPMTLDATWNKSANSPIADTYVTGVSARGQFKRSAFGMNYGVGNGWVGDTVELIVEFEAIRQ